MYRGYPKQLKRGSSNNFDQFYVRYIGQHGPKTILKTGRLDYQDEKLMYLKLIDYHSIECILNVVYSSINSESHSG